MASDPSKSSQRQRILEALRLGVALTPVEALERFGCFRLAARVNDLKAAGHCIRREMITNAHGIRFARYQLETLPHAQE